MTSCLMSRYIKKLIESGENQHLDFKFQITDAKKIARSLVAFANTGGGKLLIGVKDNGRIAGIRSEEEYYMIESAAEIFSKPSVQFTSEKRVIEGKSILEIDIPESKKKPHLAPSKDDKLMAYVRVHDQNLLANKIQVKVWKRQQKKNKGVYLKYTEKDKILLDYLENNQKITFSKFMRIASIGRYRAEKILINFILLNVIEIVFTEKETFYKLKGS